MSEAFATDIIWYLEPFSLINIFKQWSMTKLTTYSLEFNVRKLSVITWAVEIYILGSQVTS